MLNKILDSNPYGPLKHKDLESFENRIGHRLPEDYRAYLLTHNGGKPEKFCFRTAENQEEFLNVTNLYSLGSVPQDHDLSERWDLAAEFDLKKFTTALGNYIVFGSATSGGALLLQLETGKVQFYDPDHEEPNNASDLTRKFETVAPNFELFISTLVSEELADELESEL